MALLWTPGAGELIVILLIVLVLFGANKVPQLMRGMGQGVREFKKAVSDDEPPAKEQDAAQADKKPDQP
jgi:sec-independent protein translocase protein TatA